MTRATSTVFLSTLSPSALSIASIFVAMLLSSCSSIYGAQPPFGCEAPEDGDGDGFLKPACLANGSPLADCNDEDPAINPGAVEVCNGIDDNCDGRTDELLLATAYYPDCDGDGAGAPGPVAASCDVAGLRLDVCDGEPTTWVTRDGDCDDANPDVGPAATEVCNGIDDDCDFRVDEELTATAFYPDCDGDGAGAPSPVAPSCDVALLDPAVCDGSPGTWVDNANDCDDTDPHRTTSCGACGAVDLLFVIDDTASMGPAQALAAAQLPALVTALATGDLDGDGTIETQPLADFQVGVLSTDYGDGGYETSPACTARGDDGLLRDFSGGGSAACMRAFPAFLAFDPSSDPAALAADLVCLAAVGTSGCILEQPLESSLAALTPAGSPVRFRVGELGRGDLENRGFLREGSILVVIVLTDEDDCSIADYVQFMSGTGLPRDVQCALDRSALFGLERYTSGLLALRRAEDLVFAVVGGVPVDLATNDPTDADYASALADPRMVPTLSPTSGALLPACTAGAIQATPPVRLTGLGRALDARGVDTILGSVCESSLAGVRSAVVDSTFRARDARCGL